MDLMRQWGMALCCAALAGGIAQMLAPGAAMNRIFRIALGAFFLCCLIDPFIGIRGDRLQELNFQLSHEQQDTADQLSSKAEELFLSDVQERLVRLTQKKLENMGINEGQVTVYINETSLQLQPEDIVIEMVLPNTYRDRHDEICRQLEYELGLTLRVGYIT